MDTIAETIKFAGFGKKKAMAKTSTAPTGKVEKDMYDVADEIRELKDLLDDGILTQEEFDAKKKQLLGI